MQQLLSTCASSLRSLFRLGVQYLLSLCDVCGTKGVRGTVLLGNDVGKKMLHCILQVPRGFSPEARYTVLLQHFPMNSV